MSMLPPEPNVGRVRTSSPKMSTCTCNKAEVEEKGPPDGENPKEKSPEPIENEPSLPSPKSNTPISNDSTSQKSPSQRRRHQRGGRKKKSVPEPNDGLQPPQGNDDTSLNPADHERHTAGTNRTQHKPPYSRSTTAHSDYSDLASVDSQNPTATRRRRHQRGGRRKPKGPSHLQSVSEFSIGRDQAEEYDATPSDPEWREWNNENDEGEGYDDAELRKARSSRRSRSMGKEKRDTDDRKGDTGIRAFNLRRADESGGRPIGISVDREDNKKPKESKGRPTKGKGKGREKRREEDSDESKEEEKDKRKPVSIRLDLNLELEIFLRAKIKGDITITFLDGQG